MPFLLFERKSQGQITIFVAFMLLVSFPLLLLLVSAAQQEVSETYFLYAAKSAKNNMKASYCREFYEDYDLFLFWENPKSAEEQIKDYLEKYEKPSEKAALYGSPLIAFKESEVDVHAYRMATDEGGECLIDQILHLEKKRVLLDSVFSAVDSNHSYKEGEELLKQMNENLGQMEAEWENTTTEQEQTKGQGNISLQDFRSLWNLIKEIKENPVVTFIFGKEKISSQVIPAVQYEDNEEGEENAYGFYEKYLLANYLQKHFVNYTENSEEEEIYELEYILSGKSTDQENLKKAMEKFLMWKGAVNLVCAYNNEAMVRQAEEMSSVLYVIGGSAASEGAALMILALLSYGEAVMDAKRLVNGHRVNLWKEAGDWKLSLEQGAELLENPESCMVSDKNGIGYSEYLKYLLLLEDWDDLKGRMMNVMQWNMQKENPYFYLEQCVCEMKYHLHAKSIGIGTVFARKSMNYQDQLKYGIE